MRAGRHRSCAIFPAAGGEGEQGFGHEAEEGSYEKAGDFVHSLCADQMFPDVVVQRLDEMAGSGSNNASAEFVDASEGKFFKLEHCWTLKECDKWKLIDKESPPKRGSLMNMDEDEDDDGPRNMNKRDGDKKTKEKIEREHEASSLRDKIYALVQSNELMLAKTFEIKKELAEKKAQEKQETWQLLKDEGLHKAAIEERRARAAENQTMSNLLAEENMTITMNHNIMDDITKEWHDMARRDILKRRMLASAGACYSAGHVFSSGF
ncbi:Lactation elevated protein 1 [Hordeum vulgare]|nr:Lactation elevated protein 1 [Hordeum vulgare]